jgi:hypothetical protein
MPRSSWNGDLEAPCHVLRECTEFQETYYMSSLSTRTFARGLRVARVQQARSYAAKVAEHPPGYVPTGEEWIAQRKAVQDHASCENTFTAHSSVLLSLAFAFSYKQSMEEH